MIQGLAITPPVVGRISIGRVVEKNGLRVPEKDDQFTLTTQIQTREGWVLHPLDTELRQQTDNGKLRSLPVTLLFNDPALNFRADYTLFDRSNGRPLCVGDGLDCRRSLPEGVDHLPCPAPAHCAFGADAGCKPYGRLNVRIGDEDSLGAFIFRTTGFNSIRTLIARLQYLYAVSGGLLACLPLSLKLRGKSTTLSHRTPIFYVDLVIREGMTLEEAISQARHTDAQRRDAGVDQSALDEAARKGFANGTFEDTDEDLPGVLEEFYPDQADVQTALSEQPSDSALSDTGTRSLANTLARKANGSGAVHVEDSSPTDP